MTRAKGNCIGIGRCDFFRCRGIVVHGREAHSSKPHLGTNAIVHMTEFIQAIEQDAQSLYNRSRARVGMKKQYERIGVPLAQRERFEIYGC